MRAERPDKGFTIIELVVVIVLVGIVGAVIISRFVGPNAFEIAAAQDGLLTTIRAAQQAALGRTDATLVAFEIDQSGGDWVLTARDGATTLRTLELPADNIVLETGSAVASADTCATGFDTAVSGDFELVFEKKGNLDEFTNNGTTEMVDAMFNGVRNCVNDSPALSVCVSPAGYAYAGNCDD